LDQILAPDLFWEAGEGQHVVAGGVQVRGHRREFVGDGVDEPVVLGVY
jgi:hypothetical protein